MIKLELLNIMDHRIPPYVLCFMFPEDLLEKKKSIFFVMTEKKIKCSNMFLVQV